MDSATPRIKVAYDISVLGSGVLDPVARTGVFRVVESLARALNASGECDLRLCAGGPTFHSLYGAMRYLRASPDLAARPFVSSNRRARLHSWVLDRTLPQDAGEDQRSGLVGRVGRALRGRTAGFAVSRRFPIPEGVLDDAEIFHSPYFPLPDWPARPGRARVLTVYDLIAIRHPELYEPHVEEHDRAILRSITPGDHVTCISEATRADLCEFTGISPERVFVTPLAASPTLFRPSVDGETSRRVREAYGLPEGRYLLAVGTLKPGKNLVTAVRAFARLVAAEGLDDLDLVLVGARGWDFEGIFDAASEAGPLRERIHFTGFVADEDLAAIYTGALAFIFPSLLEGFGLPALEAMQCGVPVVASNSSAIPEVVGDGGILVDPMDVDGFCAALLSLYRDETRRAELAARALDRARSFSWERCAAATLAAYRAALVDGP